MCVSFIHFVSCQLEATAGIVVSAGVGALATIPAVIHTFTALFMLTSAFVFFGGDEIYDAGRSGSTVSANQTWKLGKLLTRTGRILATTTGAKI